MKGLRILIRAISKMQNDFKSSLNPLKWFEMGFKRFQAIQAIQDKILH
jgi:hypothetical protein